MNWVEVPAGQYKIPHAKQSSCQIEISVRCVPPTYATLEAHRSPLATTPSFLIRLKENGQKWLL